MKKNTIRILAIAVAVLMLAAGPGGMKLTAQSGAGENSLDVISSKGYIPNWLFCGVFSTGVQGGMTGLIISQKANLTTKDYLESAGGELGIEPVLGMKIDRGGGKSNEWISFEPKDYVLDLGDVYPKFSEGVMYGAAYMDSPKPAALYLDVEAVSGVAIWINHKLAWRSSPGLLGEAGKEKVLVQLKPGRNLLLIKFAGVKLQKAADTLKVDMEDVKSFVRGVSATLAEASGMAASVKASPMTLIGNSSAAVQSALQPTGYFRGDSKKPLMECALTVANAGDSAVGGIAVDVESKMLNYRTTINVSLEPRANKTVLVQLPVGLKFAGKTADVRITAHVGSNKVVTDSGVFVSKGVPSVDETAYIIPGFHADPVWIEDQRDYAVALLGSAQQNMFITGADPYYGVYMSELDTTKPFYDAYPEFREQWKRLIKERRIGSGGSYNQPVEKMISGEALVRNLLYGKLFHEKVLGDTPRVYMGWDIFGHVAQLSQILKKTRNDGAMWSKAIVGFPPLFWHESLDGTKLLHKRTQYGSEAKNLNALRDTVNVAFNEFRSYGLRYDARLDAGDFKPPTPFYAGNTFSLRSLQPSLFVTGVGGNKFFRGVLDDIAQGRGKDIPVTSRDMSYYHQGTGLSRVDLKIGNRLAENGVQNAEKFAAIANLMGMPYPDKMLDKAWRQLLFGQHHDALTGTINDKSFVDLMAGYRESMELSSEVTSAALDHIGGRIDTAAAKAPAAAIPVVVFNPLAWARTDIVRAKITPPAALDGFTLSDASGNDVPFEIESLKKDNDGKIVEAVAVFAARVPSLGYVTYYAVPSDALPQSATRSEADGNAIETAEYRIEVDPAKGGGISSLVDKIGNKEYIKTENGVGNDIVRLREDSGRHEPPWEIFTMGDPSLTSDNAATVKVVEGPVSKRLIVRGKVGDTETERRIILYNEVPRVDFETFIEDYKGHNSSDNELFAVAFPVDLPNSVPVFEERYGAVVKKKSRQKYVFQTWQMHNYSDHGMMTAYQWMDESWSVNLKLMGADGRVVSAYPLGMVSMVTDHNSRTVRAMQLLQDALVRKGIHSTPWYDDYDAGRLSKLTFSDSTMPDDLNKDLAFGTSFRISLNIGKNNLYTQRVLAMMPPETVAEFERRVKENGWSMIFVIDPTAPGEWPDIPLLIVKGRDAAGLDAAVAKLSDDVKRYAEMRVPASCNAATVSPGPENFGMAFINQGNILNSVERDDTVVMFLVHTASFFRRLPFELVPESKTNAFYYSLYPHKGNWVEAKSFRAGFEFNNPLTARQSTMHGGTLPAKGMAFLTVEPTNLVVTAVKPSGNPTAAFSAKPNEASKGLTVRLYEAAGVPAEGVVKLAGGIKNAWSANLLEEKQAAMKTVSGNLPVSVTPFSIETYELVPEWKNMPVSKTAALNETERAQPVFSRYWMHNAGATPLGFFPVSVVMQGNIKTKIHIRQGGVTINRVSVTVTNDYTDKTVSGTARIKVPKDWKALPESFNYEIKPGGHQTKEVIICFLGAGRTGLIKAQIEHGGQTIEDVIDVDTTSLPFDVTRDGDIVNVKISNPNAQRVNAELSLIGPVESWGRDLAGGFGLVSVSPRNTSVALDPNEERTYSFRVDPESGDVNPSIWLIAKLAYYGKVYYKEVPAK